MRAVEEVYPSKDMENGMGERGTTSTRESEGWSV